MRALSAWRVSSDSDAKTGTRAAALGELGRETIEAFAPGKSREIAADGDNPGVVGRRRVEPNNAVLGGVELLHLVIALRRVLPGRIVVAVKEDTAVAGIFGIEIDLAGEERRSHDVRGAELDAAIDGDAARRHDIRDHVAE